MSKEKKERPKPVIRMAPVPMEPEPSPAKLAKDELNRTFKVGFWQDHDQRYALAREIKRRVDQLRESADVSSVQRDIVVQRCVFLSLQIESMETVAARTGQLDASVYGALVNTLLGCLRAIGFDRPEKPITSLAAHIASKKAKGR